MSMKDRALDRWALYGFFIAMLLAILFAASAWRNSVKLEELSRRTAHSRLALSAASQVSLDLLRAEMAQRSYAVYGTPEYLARRNESLLRLARVVKESEGIIPAAEQAAISRSLGRLDVWHARNASLARGRGDVNRAYFEAGFGEAIPAMEQAATVYERILEAESYNLRESGTESAYLRNAGHASLILFIFFFLLSAGLFRVVWQRMGRRNRLDGKEVAADDAGGSRPGSELIVHVSHELRTSINAIIGLSELLKDGRLGRLDSAQARHIGTIHDCARHLRALVNNILDLSKTEAGKMRPDLVPCNITELCEDTVASVREMAASRHISLHLDVAPFMDRGHVYLDAVKVRQILLNLLSNAIKFTGEGGCVELCVRRVERAGVGRLSGRWPSLNFPLAASSFTEFLSFNVLDNGIGISAELMQGLFQPYVQAGNRPDALEGTGLGLALVRRFAELHGGTVAMESADGQGARFAVWLPLRLEEEAAPQQLPAVQSGLGGMRVPAFGRGLEALFSLARQRTFLNA